MPSLCIQDLVTATNGSIRMGAMPPLGGAMAPVGRLVHMKSEVRNGDVVVVTTGATTNGTGGPSSPDPSRSHFDTNEVFAKGALGIISDVPVCPWDGRFSLQVNDMNVSRKMLLRFVRDRFDGPVVVVLGAESESVADLLRARLENTTDQTTNDSDKEMAETSDALWQVLATPADADAIIANIDSNESTGFLSALRPTVVIATVDVSPNEIQKVIGLAAPNGILVLENCETANSEPPQVVDSKWLLPKGWATVSAVDHPGSGIHAELVRAGSEAIAGAIEMRITKQARVA